MSRLSSFRGPSTPNASPVRQPSNPQSPGRVSESTFHRKTRTLLQELRATALTWDDLILVDGLKAAKTLIDTRTELDNALVANPLPRILLVGPKLSIMDNCISDLDIVLQKLARTIIYSVCHLILLQQKQFRKMTTIIDSLEALLIEAHKTKGWRWAQEEPLWVTWSLEKFVTCISEILIPYHRSLYQHVQHVDTIRNHSVTFEDSKNVVTEWVAQIHLAENGWSAKWEEICTAEVERWNGKYNNN